MANSVSPGMILFLPRTLDVRSFPKVEPGKLQHMVVVLQTIHTIYGVCAIVCMITSRPPNSWLHHKYLLIRTDFDSNPWRDTFETTNSNLQSIDVEITSGDPFRATSYINIEPFLVKRDDLQQLFYGQARVNGIQLSLLKKKVEEVSPGYQASLLKDSLNLGSGQLDYTRVRPVTSFENNLNMYRNYQTTPSVDRYGDYGSRLFSTQARTSSQYSSTPASRSNYTSAHPHYTSGTSSANAYRLGTQKFGSYTYGYNDNIYRNTRHSELLSSSSWEQNIPRNKQKFNDTPAGTGCCSCSCVFYIILLVIGALVFKPEIFDELFATI